MLGLAVSSSPFALCCVLFPKRTAPHRTAPKTHGTRSRNPIQRHMTTASDEAHEWNKEMELWRNRAGGKKDACQPSPKRTTSCSAWGGITPHDPVGILELFFFFFFLFSLVSLTVGMICWKCFERQHHCFPYSCPSTHCPGGCLALSAGGKRGKGVNDMEKEESREILTCDDIRKEEDKRAKSLKSQGRPNC